MRNDDRILQLNNIKWILTILIVLYHVGYSTEGKIEENICLYIRNLGDCVVPAFTIISGFLFWRNIDSFETVKEKMRRRVFSILIPYVVWNIINTIFINTMNMGIKNINKSVFTINLFTNLVLWDSSPHFWYLFMILFWTLLAPFLYYVYRRKIFTILLFVSQIIYLFLMGDNILHSRYIYMLFTWSGLLGLYYPNFFNSILDLPKEKKKILILCSLILYFALGIVTSFLELSMAVLVWIYAIRAIFLIIGSLYVPILYWGRKTSFKYSFWLFAIHYWLDRYVGIYLSRISSGCLNQLLTWVCVLGLGICSGILINKIFPRLYKFLSGNR